MHAIFSAPKTELSAAVSFATLGKDTFENKFASKARIRLVTYNQTDTGAVLDVILGDDGLKYVQCYILGDGNSINVGGSKKYIKNISKKLSDLGFTLEESK